ncbi:MAG: TonB-dependent vitamin B12 receptor [Gammaproteobacteria bacterium]|nr:TonB-dependent vitamin B12 receptor [Gammaproteobacteria bacterium]
MKKRYTTLLPASLTRFTPLLGVLLSAPLLTSQAVLAATKLDPVIVTAARTAQTSDETLAAVTVINRDDIERQQARSVQDILRGVPGVSISNNGGAGKVTSLFLRGTESDHVLVLIDGVKVGSATAGTAAFQDMPVELIERIEIVRGPRSSLYGSEAVGGVIQIFTRKGSAASKPFFTIGGGSYGSAEASIGVSERGENGWFSASASGASTDGFNACDGKPFPGGAGCFTIEPDKDGNRTQSRSLRAGYRTQFGLEVDAHALRTSSETEFDGSAFSGNESESLQDVLGATIRYSLADIWQLTLSGGRSLDESDTLKDGILIGRINTQRDTLSLQSDHFITDNHLVTIGADYQDDRVDSATAYVVTDRDNRGLFTQYQGSFAAHDIEVSLRSDDNEQFGKRTTGGAAWGWAFAKNLRVTAAYGTAFKAPTFNELYWPGFGNPDLEPETSRSAELGLRGHMDWASWSVNLYETRVKKLIAFDAATFAPVNVGEARMRGIETTLTTQISAWNLSANLTLLDPKDRSSGANKGNTLARRTKQSLRFDADRDFGKYGIGATLLAEGKRYDDSANTRKISGYSTIDFRAQYRLTKAWKLQARIENLLDKEYETASFYNQPGRSFFVTLRYQPQA